MEREEFKKKLIENYKNKIKVKFDCKWTKCNECPFYNRVCPSDNDIYQKVMEEAWAETHGYVKKENLFVEDTEDEELEQSNEKTESTVPINLGEIQSQEQFPFDDIPISDLTIPIPRPTTPELKWGFLKETLKVLIQEERSQAQKEAYQKILKIMDGFDGVA